MMNYWNRFAWTYVQIRRQRIRFFGQNDTQQFFSFLFTIWNQTSWALDIPRVLADATATDNISTYNMPGFDLFLFMWFTLMLSS